MHLDHLPEEHPQEVLARRRGCGYLWKLQQDSSPGCWFCLPSIQNCSESLAHTIPNSSIQPMKMVPKPAKSHYGNGAETLQNKGTSSCHMP